MGEREGACPACTYVNDGLVDKCDELRAELAIARGEVERLQLPQRVTLAELDVLRTSLAAIEKTNELLQLVLREEIQRLRELLRECLNGRINEACHRHYCKVENAGRYDPLIARIEAALAEGKT